MPAKKSGPQKKTGFSKVGETLYRYNPSGVYYALVKKSGKQIRRSLKTVDRKLAERRLVDFKRKIDRIKPGAQAKRSPVEFHEAADLWLNSMRSHLKPSSFLRREVSIKQFRRTFGTSTVRSITRIECEDWAKLRSPQIATSTFNNERETLVKTMRSMDPRYQSAADLVAPVQNAKKAIGAACKKGDLPLFNHHSFRHCFVSNAIGMGIENDDSFPTELIEVFPEINDLLRRKIKPMIGGLVTKKLARSGVSESVEEIWEFAEKRMGSDLNIQPESFKRQCNRFGLTGTRFRKKNSDNRS